MCLFAFDQESGVCGYQLIKIHKATIIGDYESVRVFVRPDKNAVASMKRIMID